MRTPGFLILFILFCLTHLSKAQSWADPCRIPITGSMESLSAPSTQRPKTFSRLLHDQPTHTTYWLWNETAKTWTKNHQEWYTYNPNDLLISVRDQSWDETRWVDESRITYIYTHEKLLSLFQFEFWHEGAWHLYTRYLYDYNSDQSLHTFRVQDWIEDQWLDRTREEYETQSEPYYSRKSCAVWDESEWRNTTRETQYLTTDGNVDCTISELWNGIDWVNNSREAFTYNSNSTISKVLGQQWEYNQWNNASETQYAYNPQDQLTRKEVHLLIPSPWYQNYLWAYAYDANSNMMESSFWILDHNVFQIQMHSLNTYDQQNRILNTCSQAYKGYWLNQEYIEFEYQQYTGIKNIDVSDAISLYPNPAAEVLYLNLPASLSHEMNVSIYTLSGMLCQVIDIQNEKSVAIPIAQLLPGTYLLRVSNSGFQGEKNFIKY